MHTLVKLNDTLIAIIALTPKNCCLKPFFPFRQHLLAKLHDKVLPNKSQKFWYVVRIFTCRTMNIIMKFAVRVPDVHCSYLMITIIKERLGIRVA